MKKETKKEMRMIDANALIEKKRQFCSGHGEYDYMVELWHIENAPTEDAVEVVRCKDCKHAHLTIGSEVKYCDMWSNGEELYLPPDFHCAAGERRSDNGMVD